MTAAHPLDAAHATMVRAWHLAILRFALTREQADRVGALAVAATLDRLGAVPGAAASYGFFRRTTTALCAAILTESEAAAALLREYLQRIDDLHLRRVLATAMRVDAVEQPARGHRRIVDDLWKGLPPRRASPGPPHAGTK